MTPTHYGEAAGVILEAARQGQSAVVSCHSVHALITSSRDAGMAARVNTFEMITPDGQPVRWALNLLHHAKLRKRVYGPELMLRVCRGAAAAGIPIYLYGGRPGVTEMLVSRLCAMFPRLEDRRAETPPFTALTREEDEAVIERINSSGARVVFIGLGTPKQDVFAHEHRERIRTVQMCVGAAFDFHAGVKRMAPPWMQRCGAGVALPPAQRAETAGGAVLDHQHAFPLLAAVRMLGVPQSPRGGARRDWENRQRRRDSAPTPRSRCPWRPRRRCALSSITSRKFAASRRIPRGPSG